MRKSQDQAQSHLEEGMALARGNWGHMTESYDAGERASIAEQERLSLLGHLLENQKWALDGGLEEDFRTYNTGSFARHVFPLITSVYANLISTELFSVQPLSGPNGLIFFMELRADRTKGSTAAGTTVQSPIQGHLPATGYTSEDIDVEIIGAGDATETNFTGNVGWVPMRPFSVQVLVDGVTVGNDNGSGALAGATLASGTVNYDTGAVDVTFSVAPANGAEIAFAYRYIMEGNILRPSYKLHFTKAQIEATTHSLETAWSIESEQDLNAVHGIDAKPLVYGKIGEQLRFEIDRENIADIFNISKSTALGVWDYNPPAGIDYYRHQMTFVNMLTNVSNDVFHETSGQINPNWLVAGVDLGSVIQNLPQFKSAGPTKDKGVVYMGELDRWKIYMDPWLERDKGILGYKGDNWLEAGYVFAPYIPLWRTPNYTLTDGNRRTMLMSRFAKKLINRKHFRQISVTNFG